MRPYLILGQRELSAIAEAAHPRVESWAKAWFGKSSATPACRQAIESDASGDWWRAKLHSCEGLYIRRSTGLVKKLTGAAFGISVTKGAPYANASPLVEGFVNDLLTDLATHVLSVLDPSATSSALELDTQTPSKNHFSRGGGALLLSIECAGETIVILIPGAYASRMLRSGMFPKSEAASAPLETSVSVLQGEPITLTALLGQAEIDLGALQSLAIGDVIKLNAKIEQPVQVVTSDGLSVLSGHLGTRKNFISIQVAR